MATQPNNTADLGAAWLLPGADAWQTGTKSTDAMACHCHTRILSPPCIRMQRSKDIYWLTRDTFQVCGKLQPRPRLIGTCTASKQQQLQQQQQQWLPLPANSRLSASKISLCLHVLVPLLLPHAALDVSAPDRIAISSIHRAGTLTFVAGPGRIDLAPHSNGIGHLRRMQAALDSWVQAQRETILPQRSITGAGLLPGGGQIQLPAVGHAGALCLRLGV